MQLINHEALTIWERGNFEEALSGDTIGTLGEDEELPLVAGMRWINLPCSYIDVLIYYLLPILFIIDICCPAYKVLPYLLF